MPSIYVCFRREDILFFDPEKLQAQLAAEFGANSVVIDIQHVGPVGFLGQLRRVVSASDVVLVVIGEQWATATDPYHPAGRRIDKPTDFVRVGIATALETGKVVVPLLLGRATLPEVDDLPGDIHGLASLEAVHLNLRDSAAVKGLIEHLRDITRQPSGLRSVSAPRASSPGKPAPSSLVQAKPSQATRREPPTDARHIFVSYVEEDGSTASALAKELHKHGLSTWTYQDDGVPGHSYLAQIHQAIESCRAVLLIASTTSVNARQVIKEVEAAHEQDKMIIPVRIRLTQQQFSSANPILRMATGTAVTLSLDESNLSESARRIANGIRASERPVQSSDVGRLRIVSARYVSKGDPLRFGNVKRSVRSYATHNFINIAVENELFATDIPPTGDPHYGYPKVLIVDYQVDDGPIKRVQIEEHDHLHIDAR